MYTTEVESEPSCNDMRCPTKCLSLQQSQGKPGSVHEGSGDKENKREEKKGYKGRADKRSKREKVGPFLSYSSPPDNSSPTPSLH